MNIRQQVENLKINVNHSLISTIGELIEAEMFPIMRYRVFQKLDIEKYKNIDPDDKRVWVKATVFTKIEPLSIFQFRPFIDTGCTLSLNGEYFKFEKNYFAGEELED